MTPARPEVDMPRPQAPAAVDPESWGAASDREVAPRAAGRTSDQPGPGSAISPVRKAAIVLVSLDQSLASQLLSHLDRSAVESVTWEIARLERIEPAERAAVLEEFYGLGLRRLCFVFDEVHAQAAHVAAEADLVARLHWRGVRSLEHDVGEWFLAGDMVVAEPVAALAAKLRHRRAAIALAPHGRLEDGTHLGIAAVAFQAGLFTSHARRRHCGRLRLRGGRRRAEREESQQASEQEAMWHREDGSLPHGLSTSCRAPCDCSRRRRTRRFGNRAMRGWTGIRGPGELRLLRTGHRMTLTSSAMSAPWLERLLMRSRGGRSSFG